jgi:hypothetical protein
VIHRLFAGRPAWLGWLAGLLLVAIVLLAILASRGPSVATQSVATTLIPGASATPVAVLLSPTVQADTSVPDVSAATRLPSPSPTASQVHTQTPTVAGASPTVTAVPATATLTPSPSPGNPLESLTPSPTPAPPALPLHGIEIHQAADVALTSQAGAYWLRYNALLWNRVEPQPGDRKWSALAGLEDELQSAAAQGLQVIVIVRGTPSWAQQVPGSSCGPIRADQLSAFADFMADVVARYGQPPYNVKYWELGNEPDVDASLVPLDSPFGCWGKIGDPYYGGDYYAEMLKLVYPRIKAADPQAQVLTGGLLLDCDPVNPPETEPGSGQYRDCTPSRFLEGILHNGGGGYFDGVSFHAYDFYDEVTGHYANENWHSAWNTTGPVVVAKARYLHGLLAQYGYPGKYLMNTEGAILCGRSGQEPYCLTDEYTTLKNGYLVESYSAALAENVRANIWYSLVGWRASGLVTSERAPNSAYRAYQFNVEQLEGAAFWGEVNTYPGVKGYAFERFDDQGAQTHIWVLWSLDETNHTIVLPQEPVAVYDSSGAPLANSLTQVVGLNPIYVTWNK